MTTGELINRSLRLIGTLSPGRTAGTSETSTAVLVLNSMLDAWNAERLCPFTSQASSYTLTAGKGSYTIPGDLEGTRPLRIDQATIVIGTAHQPPLELVNAERWGITYQPGSGTPERLYYDGGNPAGTIYLCPAPSQAYTLEMFTPKLLAQVDTADLTKAIVFPPGYADAIAYNLAVRLCPEWNLAPRADVVEIARTALALIKLNNVGLTTPMRCDGAVLGGGHFNILTGE